MRRVTQQAHMIALAACLLLVAPAHAQETSVRVIINPEGLSVAQILERFARDKSAPPYRSAQERTMRAMLWQHHGDFSEAQIDSLLSGLEELALTGGDGTLRRSAVFFLANAGSPEARSPRDDVVHRLERIYEQTSHDEVRESVLTDMPRLAARGEAIRFLRRIAVQPPEEQALSGAPGYAIAMLAVAGEEGRDALRTLHRQDLVRDRDAKRVLEGYAERGFRLPQARIPPR